MHYSAPGVRHEGDRARARLGTDEAEGAAYTKRVPRTSTCFRLGNIAQTVRTAAAHQCMAVGALHGGSATAHRRLGKVSGKVALKRNAKPPSADRRGRAEKAARVKRFATVRNPLQSRGPDLKTGVRKNFWVRVPGPPFSFHNEAPHEIGRLF